MNVPGRPGQDVPAVVTPERARLHEGAEDFLEEEGISLGLPAHHGPHFFRQLRGLEEPPRHAGALLVGERPERDAGVVGSIPEGLGIAGAVRQNQEHRCARQAVGHELQIFLRGRVHPLEVLDHHDDGATPASPEGDLAEGLEDPGPPLGGLHGGHGGVSGIHRQQILEIRCDRRGITTEER